MFSYALGASLYYGAGAGMLPTAMAVVSDMIEISRNVAARAAGARPMRRFRADPAGQARPLLAADEVRTRYYLRMGVADRPGVLGQLMTILGSHHVSIAQVVQEGPRVTNRPAEATRVFVITHEAREGDVRAALAQIDALPVVAEKTRLIRIAG